MKTDLAENYKSEAELTVGPHDSHSEVSVTLLLILILALFYRLVKIACNEVLTGPTVLQ